MDRSPHAARQVEDIELSPEMQQSAAFRAAAAEARGREEGPAGPEGVLRILESHGDQVGS